MGEVDPADLSKALSEGFPPATAEKVLRLLQVLRELQAQPVTRGKFTLKGGTALNVFHWPKAPRLSVDLDLMATGYPNAAPRTPDRTRVVHSLEEVSRSLGYKVRTDPSDAVTNLTLSYRNHLGTPDSLKIDIDLLDRVTLLEPVERAGPILFDADDLRFPVVDPAELMGQKLTAVAYRHVERDLFDIYLLLLSGWRSQFPRARGMYLAYSFLQDHEWARLDYPVRLKVPYDPERLKDVLRGKDVAPSLERIREQAHIHLESIPRPFTSATEGEQDLRGRLLEGSREAFGEIAGEPNAARRRALSEHPGLLWRLKQAARPAKARNAGK